MPATQATTVAQRRKMMHLAEEGHTYAAIAEQVRVSFWAARRWIRQAKRGGLEIRKGKNCPS
ncbi:MAG: helix-turn-helix domain-containing protein [Anaerolineales bacterium]|nr:helix-turn-helix domain-containing protein [Anaerolineales bacterium]